MESRSWRTTYQRWLLELMILGGNEGKVASTMGGGRLHSLRAGPEAGCAEVGRVRSRQRPVDCALFCGQDFGESWPYQELVGGREQTRPKTYWSISW